VGLYPGIGVEELKKIIINLSDGRISDSRCNSPTKKQESHGKKLNILI
jgi:hypothetical protein